MQAELEQLLEGETALRAGAALATCQPIGGGCSQQAWRLELTDGRRLFAKRGTLLMLQAEERGLVALAAAADSADLVVPKPLKLLAASVDRAFLLLPWMDQVGGDQAALGRGLAHLHQRSRKHGAARFGWPDPGFIGLGPQPEGWRDCWGEAFVELRLLPQLRLAQAWGLDQDPQKSWLDGLKHALNRHSPDPVLVHGDLWGGNAGVLADGRGLLIDPACWWADREVDLAMTRLFGGFSQSFYHSYEQTWPLPSGASHRITIYNLYHLLNHANLFGGGYQEQSHQAIHQLKQQFG